MSLKAFDLVPVVDKVNLSGDKTKSSIECLELVQENLYIGTTDCFLIHYAIEQGISPTGKTTFMNKLQRHKHLGLRKPIKQLLACAAVGQLLVLCDGNVYSVSMYGLELRIGANKEMFKGVTVMARNNKPPVFNPDEVQICIGTKRKTVQIYTLTTNGCMMLKEINLTDPPNVLAIDSQTICTTLGHQYFLIDYVTSAVQELFMYEAHNVLPMVKRIGHEEFLLNGPTDTMGMIVTAEGLSMHQPLTWSDGLRSVAYSYPYILVLGNSTVTVHSMLDQRQKQAMSFNGGIAINNMDDHVLVAMQKSVMAFVPIPLDKQIQMLLIDKRLDEAFDLLLVANRSNPIKYDTKFVKQVQAQAGFIHFADGNFSKASELFIKSSVDPREIILLYPLMMPANKNFLPSRPLLHNIKDLTVVVKGSKTVFAEAKKFLLKYLEKCRNQFPDAKIEIDTALMKLYAECNHTKLSELLSIQNEIFVEEALSWLTQFKRFHCLALYYCYLNQPIKSLELWHKLVDKEIMDATFPGINFVVNYLCKITNVDLIWTSIGWLLKTDEEVAIKVFTQRDDDLLKIDQVCDYLQKFPIALQIYLEYLVYNKKFAQEKFHTHLAVIYVNHVLKLMKAKIQVSEEVEAARSKLQTLLETSSLYRVSTILQKIGSLPLYKEIAILYGKMDQHDKALKILVYKLNDFEAAERYCDVISCDKDHKFKQKVFHTLLLVYLQPSSEEEEEDVRAEHFVIPVVKLLNTRQKEFDFIRVLDVLPNDWSVDLIHSFLSGSVRTKLSSLRTLKIQSSLSRQDYVDNKKYLVKFQHGRILMTDSSICDFCKKPFNEPISACYPNGTLVHAHCSKNKHKCPVTGKEFT